MTNTKFSEIATKTGPLSGNETLVGLDGGTVTRVKASDIAALAGGGGGGVSSLNGLTGDITLAPGSGVTITPDGDTLTIAATGGGGTMPGAGYAARLCAMLEPDLLEGIQKDTFSYAIGNQTKYLIASWATRLGSNGRMEVRDPRQPMALKNVTLSGLQTGACAVILDPAGATYSDPWTTYYDRMLAIDNADVKSIPLEGNGATALFLPGPYGAIITQVTCFDLAWVIWRIHNQYGPNLANEISDSNAQRVSNALRIPISKRTAGGFETATAGGGMGSVSYVLLPANWSKVADPLSSSYLFRDDFMADTLDLSTWTVGGNVALDTRYHWVKVQGGNGSGAWGGNGMHTTAPISRAEGRAMVIDVYVGKDASNAGPCVGWSIGGTIDSSFDTSKFAHGINFPPGGGLNIYEDGNTNRGSVGSGISSGCIYRFRITLHSGGSATYEVQGGKEYPPIGGSTWTNITPSTSSSAQNTLYPAATTYAGTPYISDVRVY